MVRLWREPDATRSAIIRGRYPINSREHTFMYKGLLTLFLITLVPLAQAMPTLVDSQWVDTHGKDQGLVVLDIQEPPNFRRFHLPRSVNAPYAQWRTQGPKEPDGMLPPVGYLEGLLGRLGIANETKVLIVSTGLSAGEMAAAARVYWTFKAVGHKQVGILNGGLAAYAQRYGIERLKPDQWQPKPAVYKARPDQALLVGVAQVQQALNAKADLVDARSAGEYMGLHVGGEKERPGTLPGARNLPFDWLTENGSGQLLPPSSQRKLFDALGIKQSGEQIHFCHTGSRAALSWFVAYGVLGNRDAKLYDGSMAEWAPRRDLPLEQKLKL